MPKPVAFDSGYGPGAERMLQQLVAGQLHSLVHVGKIGSDFVVRVGGRGNALNRRTAESVDEYTPITEFTYVRAQADDGHWFVATP